MLLREYPQGRIGAAARDSRGVDSAALSGDCHDEGWLLKTMGQSRDVDVTSVPTRRRGSRRAHTVSSEEGVLGKSSGLPLFPVESVPAESGQGPSRSPAPAVRPSAIIPKRHAEKPPSGGTPATLRGSPGVLGRTSLPGATTARDATVLSRMFAGLFDFALLLLLDAVVVGLTLRLTGLGMEAVGVLPFLPLVAFLLMLNGGYVVLLTRVGGQTFGQMVLRIRVVDLDGGSVTISTALVRAVALGLAMLPLGAGIAWMCVASRRDSVQDRIAGTRVTRV